MRISDWSSDVCSSDLWTIELRRSIAVTSASELSSPGDRLKPEAACTATTLYSGMLATPRRFFSSVVSASFVRTLSLIDWMRAATRGRSAVPPSAGIVRLPGPRHLSVRPEEHTSELQSLMRNSYAVFCLKKKKTQSYKS